MAGRTCPKAAVDRCGLPRIVDRLVLLGNEGMASGIDETFDIDTFVEETLAGA